MSLSGGGEVAGQCLEVDVWVVVFNLELEFLHSGFVVWKEGEVDSVDSNFSPGAVGDDGDDVAVRKFLEGSKYGLLVLKNSCGCAVFP